MSEDIEEILEEVALTDADGEDSALSFTPLAEFGKATPVQDSTNTDTDDVDTIAGSVINVVVDATTTTSYARGGIVHIPAGIVQAVTQPLADSTLGQTGIVSNVQSGGAWGITQGVIQVGLADTTSGPGVIAGAEIKKLQGKNPTVVSGMLNIPLAQAGLNLIMTVEDTPGGIKGIGYGQGQCFGIVDGVIYIPQPPTVPGGAGYFPDGIRNAASGTNMTWEAFFNQSGVVPMSNPVNGFRISAFPFKDGNGNYLSLILESV